MSPSDKPLGSDSFLSVTAGLRVRDSTTSKGLTSSAGTALLESLAGAAVSDWDLATSADETVARAVDRREVGVGFACEEEDVDASGRRGTPIGRLGLTNGRTRPPIGSLGPIMTDCNSPLMSAQPWLLLKKAHLHDSVLEAVQTRVPRQPFQPFDPQDPLSVTGAAGDRWIYSKESNQILQRPLAIMRWREFDPRMQGGHREPKGSVVDKENEFGLVRLRCVYAPEFLTLGFCTVADI